MIRKILVEIMYYVTCSAYCNKGCQIPNLSPRCGLEVSKVGLIHTSPSLPENTPWDHQISKCAYCILPCVVDESCRYHDKQGNNTKPRACMECRIPVERFLMEQHPENKPQGCAKRLKLKQLK